MSPEEARCNAVLPEEFFLFIMVLIVLRSINIETKSSNP
jgi:hypothetical protein